MIDPSRTARSTAEVATPQARRYLQQLCKHFQHKRPVTFDDRAGRIELRAGECRLDADESTLRLSLSAANAANMAELQDVVVRHLVRFAFREELQITWDGGAGAEAATSQR